MEIREVHRDMMNAVKAFLTNRDEIRDANNWDGLFNYPWKPEGLPYGYAIFNQDKMVGFLGTIFSERQMQGKTWRCCNTTCWFVEGEFRNQMEVLKLFAPILKMKDLLITNMTPSDGSIKICQQFGYRFLDQEQVTVPVLPIPSFAMEKHLSVSFDPNEIEAQLPPEEKKIFQDHAGFKCKHFLIKERQSGEHCYGIATALPIRRLQLLKGQWLNLCYLSNAAVFARNYRRIRMKLHKEGRFFVLRYDARLVAGQLSRFESRDKRTRQYKSAVPLSWTIDNLYSELITFNKY
jgi:acetoacetyl-CoA synthetase